MSETRVPFDSHGIGPSVTLRGQVTNAQLILPRIETRKDWEEVPDEWRVTEVLAYYLELPNDRNAQPSIIRLEPSEAERLPVTLEKGSSLVFKGYVNHVRLPEDAPNVGRAAFVVNWAGHRVYLALQGEVEMLPEYQIFSFKPNDLVVLRITPNANLLDLPLTYGVGRAFTDFLRQGRVVAFDIRFGAKKPNNQLDPTA